MSNHTNICVVIHEPEIVTVTMTEQQLQLLQMMCDAIRDDDDDTNPCVGFAEALYQNIHEEVAVENTRRLVVGND